MSDVRAMLFNSGNLFYGPVGDDYVNSQYVVPKSGTATPLYAANIWVGGMVDGELRTAAARFTNYEFWPGSLEEGATLPDPNDCSGYDRIWVVNARDIADYENSGIPTTDLAEWPIDLGAEIEDGDGIAGNYNLAGGDRPRLYGGQTAFWVMNDVGNEHVRTESDPIGLEVQVTAFAVPSRIDALNQSTFYRYRLLNRNTLDLKEARFTLWVDADLGQSGDEYPGVDTTRALAFVYNADLSDKDYGVPPAFGIDFLQGAEAFIWAINSGPPGLNDPVTKQQVYRMQQGMWNDGTPLTEAGSGYQTGGPETSWLYPGDPVTDQCWSAVNNCQGGRQTPANHRLILSSPPFDLSAGASRTFDIALVFAQGTDNIDSITELRAADDIVQAAYDDGSLFGELPTLASEDDGAALPGTALTGFYPNPVRDVSAVTYRVDHPGPVHLAIYDVLGQQVAVLKQGPVAAGDHRARFEAGQLASGLYIAVLEAGSKRHVRKLLVVR